MERKKPEYKSQSFSLRVPRKLVKDLESVLHPFETKSEFFRRAIWREVRSRQRLLSGEPD